ncbi:MAG TPA: ketoacyl-ACP synthase III [Caldilineales bacterium]|nr:ketoacyl-ACP synthase III [Caldilineales bacterium]
MPFGRYAHIVGWGKAVPDRVVTNDELAQIVDTSDEWIRTRTGIRQRHIAVDPAETTASLGAKAARAALEVANLSPTRVDMIICATSSPEHAFPATACIIQDMIGASNAGAFDLSAACSGFVYGLGMAKGLIASGQAENVLVIGAETLSRIVDWSDRNTCVLFGDGAGAVVVQASAVPGGILSTELGADGSGAELLTLPAGGSKMPATLESVASGQHFIKMNGRAVFRFATRVMADATRKVLDRAGLSVDDVDLVVPHQANIRIIQSSMRQLGLPEEKVFINLQDYGNTSTASIPIALTEAIEQNRIQPNDTIVMVGFGSGLTWAGAAIRWGVPTERETTFWQSSQHTAAYNLARARSQLLRISRRLEGAFTSEDGATLAELMSKRFSRRRKTTEENAPSAATESKETEGRSDEEGSQG